MSRLLKYFFLLFALTASATAAAIFPFPTAPPLPYNSGVLNLVWIGGQSLAVGGSGTLATLASIAGTTRPPHKKVYDAFTGTTPWLFWNPNTAVTQGEYMFPADPNDGGLFVNDGGNCTTGNTAEPAWVRTVGSTKTDGTCFWITADASTAHPYDIDASADAATLQLVNESAPTRVLNASASSLSNGDGFPYPNNDIGESIDTFLISQIGLMRGGVWGPVTTAIANADYAHIKPGGSQNSYAAALWETHAWHDNLVPANYGTGYKTHVAGIVWEHGEANASTAKDTYAANLVAYQAQAQIDIQTITGQTEPVPMLVSPQTSAAGGMLSSASGSMQGTLDACTGFGSRVYCAESKYAREVGGDGTHRKSGAYVGMAEKNAEVLNDVANNVAWLPTTPTAIDCSAGGGTTCNITYNVPRGCLQFDTNLPAPHGSGTFSVWSGCHGYELWKANNTTQTCSSATITSCNTVQVVAATADVGTVGYASVADATAPCTGCELRSGQLQDQDTFVGIDSEVLSCTCTSGSARVSACTGGATVLDNRRSLWDSVAGSGFAAGTVAVNRSGGTGTMDMSNTWSGGTGTCSLTWHHDMTNRGMPFQVAVGAATSVACTDITAATSGQTARCSGVGFLGSTSAGAAIPKVWVNGTEVVVSYLSSTTIELTGSMPTLAAGSYLVEVQNPYGVRTSFSNAITAKTSGGSTDTWASIWNLACRGAGDETGIVGSPATTWTDQCGFKKDLTAFAGSAGLTVTATDANFNNAKTVTGNGTNDDMQVTSFPGVATAQDAILMIMAARLLSTTNARVPMAYHAGGNEFQRNSTNAVYIGNGPSVTFTGTDPLNASKGWFGWTPGGSGSKQAGIAINNGTQVLGTAASENATQTSDTLSLFSRPSASIPCNIAVAAWAFISLPNGTTYASISSQLARTQALFASRYGFTIQPSNVVIAWQPSALAGLVLLAGALRRRRAENNTKEEVRHAA